MGMNSPRSIYSNMNPWLSIFGLFFSVLKSLLGIARQCSREKFAILSLKPWGQVSTLIYVDNHCTAAILEFLLIGEFQILEMNVNNYMFQ